jgi:hypothetical protein
MVGSLIYLLVVLPCEAGICLPISANKEVGIDADSKDSKKHGNLYLFLFHDFQIIVWGYTGEKSQHSYLFKKSFQIQPQPSV